MKRSPRVNGACWAALMASVGPPIAWMISNLVITWSSDASPAVWSSPMTLLLCVAAVSALLIVVAFIDRRRATSELCWLVALSGASSVLALVLALAAPLAMETGPTILYEPSQVHDRTGFAKAYNDLVGGFPGDGEYVHRDSWALDEFGVVPPGVSATGLDFVGYWEEYGLPFRCVRSTMHFGLHRPDRNEYVSLFPHVLSQLRIRPVALIADALLLAIIVLAWLKLPRWVIARHRSQADRCPRCGYLARGLRRCPECGSSQRD